MPPHSCPARCRARRRLITWQCWPAPRLIINLFRLLLRRHWRHPLQRDQENGARRGMASLWSGLPPLPPAGHGVIAPPPQRDQKRRAPGHGQPSVGAAAPPAGWPCPGAIRPPPIIVAGTPEDDFLRRRPSVRRKSIQQPAALFCPHRHHCVRKVVCQRVPNLMVRQRPEVL